MPTAWRAPTRPYPSAEPECPPIGHRVGEGSAISKHHSRRQSLVCQFEITVAKSVAILISGDHDGLFLATLGGQALKTKSRVCCAFTGYPQRDSNPCYRLERAGA